jgi:hypothetical protein
VIAPTCKKEGKAVSSAKTTNHFLSLTAYIPDKRTIEKKMSMRKLIPIQSSTKGYRTSKNTMETSRKRNL